MRWTVVWDADALQKLADFWLTSADPDAITAASNWFDHTLLHHPERGVLQEDGYHLRQGPLEIRYSVSPMDCKVTVADVLMV